MPLIVGDDNPALDTGRLTFRERLRTGRVVPIVSNRAIYDRMLGGYAPFLASYARYIKYPLGQANSVSTHFPYQAVVSTTRCTTQQGRRERPPPTSRTAA